MQESGTRRWTDGLLRFLALVVLVGGAVVVAGIAYFVFSIIKSPPVPERRGPSVEDIMAVARIDCRPPGQPVVLTHDLLCVQGLTPTDMGVIYGAPLPGRMVQWDAPDILPRGDELTAAWPTGVVSIRISQGSLRDVPGPLVPSTLPDMLEGQEGPFTYHYPQALRFRGEHLFIRCRPTLRPAARGIYVESCAVFIPMPNDLRLTVYADAGAFYDGGPGWPTLLRDYDPAAWQASLDEVAAFLDVVVLSRERRSEFNPGAGEP